MKTDTPLPEIAQALRAHERFVVMSHVRPDGDALGCELAMALCLRQMGKQVTVWNEDGMLDKYRYLPCSELVTQPPAAPGEFDVAIALDTASYERLGENCIRAMGQPRLLINLDHHVSNNRYGDLAHIDSTAPATGQILFDLVRQNDLPLTYEMADNLFVAISTDTGSFQYPQTTARTFEIAGELIRTGVDVGKLSQQTYESYPLRRVRLLGALLGVMKITCEGRVGIFGLSRATAAELGVLPEDNEGLIDHIRAIEGIVVAVFFEELEQGKVRLSMRSKDPQVDVSKICGLYGGGGHKLAAGARVAGSLAEVEDKVLRAICEEFDDRG